jgi:hypothetical protein
VRILDAFDAPQDADPLQFETISLSEELAPSRQPRFWGVQQTKDYSGGWRRLPEFSGGDIKTPLTRGIWSVLE